MTFPFSIYAAAFVVALIGSAASFPLWRWWCERSGHVDDPGHRKIHHTPVPLAGGFTVMTGFFLPIVAGLIFVLFIRSSAGVENTVRDLFQYGFSRRALQLTVILGGAFGMVLIGWLDDRYELSPKVKLLGQILIAVAVAASGIRITVFIPNPFLNGAFTVLWILAITNALNFLDNMNGLCSGLGIIISWYCAWTAAIHGQFLVATLGFAICGALAGFLPFNFPHAKAFLGDAGSHLVAFLSAVLAILPNFYSAQTPHKAAVIGPLFILAVPLFDLVSVIWIRVKAGQPIYVGDTNHISHRLVRRGYTKSMAVLLILLAAAATGSLTFLFF